jgi:hypothetical protein
MNSQTKTNSARWLGKSNRTMKEETKMKNNTKNGTVQITVTPEQFSTIKTALLLELERNRRNDNDDRAEEIVAMIKDAFDAVCRCM